MSVLEERRLNSRIVERRWWDIGVGSCRSWGDGSVGNGRAVVGAGASDARRDLTIISYSDGASFSRDSSSCGENDGLYGDTCLCACLLGEVPCIVGIQSSYRR